MIETSTLLQSYPAAAAGTALLAGIASSVSPCTVAAVPLVVGYIGGYADGSRRLALLYAGAFVLGLSLVFTNLGLAVALANTAPPMPCKTCLRGSSALPLPTGSGGFILTSTKRFTGSSAGSTTPPNPSPTSLEKSRCNGFMSRCFRLKS